MKHILPIAVIVVLLVVAFQHKDGPGPIPDDSETGLRTKVMIVAETAPNPAYTHEQDVALNSARSGDVRAWLDEHCKKQGLRILDPDEDISEQDKFWRDAFAVYKTQKLPFVARWNGVKWAAEGTFANVEELKKIVGMK